MVPSYERRTTSISARRRSGVSKPFHLQRTRFEVIAERKLRTDDGNVEITGRDPRKKTSAVGQGSLFEAGSARVL